MNPENLPSRRDVLKTLGAGAALIGLGAMASQGRAAAAASAPAPAASATPPTFTLPPLGYAYDALEPHIDARTMEIHYTKHHQAYINNANAALKDNPALQNLTAQQILETLPSGPGTVGVTLRNNVGGHVNHSFFWTVIGPAASSGAPSGALAVAINQKFGSLDAFKTQFADAAAKRFGSGWAWLNVRGGSLAIESTANQDSPLSDGGKPVLALDVWEHAYYLKYQNVRADYVKAFWNVVNWRQVGANYAAATASA